MTMAQLMNPIHKILMSWYIINAFERCILLFKILNRKLATYVFFLWIYWNMQTCNASIKFNSHTDLFSCIGVGINSYSSSLYAILIAIVVCEHINLQLWFVIFVYGIHYLGFKLNTSKMNATHRFSKNFLSVGSC